MQIKNNNSIPMIDAINKSSSNIKLEINKEVFDKISEFIIKDEVVISDEGQNLLESSSKKDMFDPSNIKVCESDIDFEIKRQFFDELIGNLFIDLALDYKNQITKLVDSKDNALSIERLNEAYKNYTENNIDRIANDIDSYFDKGRGLSDLYSEEPLDDLFDKEVFKDNLKTLIIDTKDYIMNTDEPFQEDILEKLMSAPKTTELEKMNFKDLKVLYNFIMEPTKFGESINQYDINSAEKIANKEKNLNKSIMTLNLSSNIKNSMFKVNSRVSDGMLKHIAFTYEKEMYTQEMEVYNLLLQNLMNRICKIGLSIQSIKENQGISLKNKNLLKYLGQEQKFKEHYNELKNEKNNKEKEFTYLDNNKHKIVELDSYKKIKVQYDECLSTNV
jgi:hypothetical protein